ncbi:hypothetical protein [Asaia astilbis]|uniref:hypothetical protein n=1 Tax=Asaia astilbis TaxID=610244 RepID=UPI000A605BDB|nr:hypothetical protein [Asaia astilbis]
MQGNPGYWRARKGMWRAVYRQTDVAIEAVAVNKRGRFTDARDYHPEPDARRQTPDTVTVSRSD